jgi:branched-chain amino acid transport system substrate-binding protein
VNLGTDILGNGFALRGFAAFLILTGTTCPVLAEAPYKVGAILSLSGRAATYPVSVKNGMEMAYHKLPASLKNSIALIYEDDASETRNAVAAWQKLKQQGVDVIVTAYSSNGHALAPLTERSGVTLLSVALDSTVVKGTKHAFHFFMSNDDLAPAAVAEAIRRGYRKIALVTTTHEGNYSMKDTFLRANAGRIEIARSEEVQLDSSDFSWLITKLRASDGISAVGVFMHPAHIGLFAKQARRLGLELPLFTFVNFPEPSVQADAAGALKGQWYVSNQLPEEFLSFYLKRYPGGSVSGAPFGYDAMLLIARAAKENVPAKAFSDYMFSVRDFEGALGRYSANGHNGFTFPVVVGEVP